jgi:hypothetical protein
VLQKGLEVSGYFFPSFKTLFLGFEACIPKYFVVLLQVVINPSVYTILLLIVFLKLLQNKVSPLYLLTFQSSHPSPSSKFSYTSLKNFPSKIPFNNRLSTVASSINFPLKVLEFFLCCARFSYLFPATSLFKRKKNCA